MPEPTWEPYGYLWRPYWLWRMRCRLFGHEWSGMVNGNRVCRTCGRLEAEL